MDQPTLKRIASAFDIPQAWFTDEKQGEAEYLYRGIAGRPFERRFGPTDAVVFVNDRPTTSTGAARVHGTERRSR